MIIDGLDGGATPAGVGGWTCDKPAHPSMMTPSKTVRKLERKMSTNISSKCDLNQIKEIKPHPCLFCIKNM